MLLEKYSPSNFPRADGPRTSAGRSAAICMLCATPIQPGEIEFETEWVCESETRLLHFHELCFRAWSQA